MSLPDTGGSGAQFAGIASNAPVTSVTLGSKIGNQLDGIAFAPCR